MSISMTEIDTVEPFADFSENVTNFKTKFYRSLLDFNNCEVTRIFCMTTWRFSRIQKCLH